MPAFVAPLHSLPRLPGCPSPAHCLAPLRWTGTYLLQPGSPPLRFITAVVSSLDFPGDRCDKSEAALLAISLHANASAAAAAEALANEHTDAWALLHSVGIGVVPANSSSSESVRRALDVATHVNSSFYFLLSSVRADWYAGVSPGGIATQNYQGAVFMDMDWWMQPALYLLRPELARATQEYRFRSLNASRDIAAVFGYNGSMLAWTAAYKGRPFGCCAGKGGYEDCLEQHVNGDAAFAAWQYYAATGDLVWLAQRGMPLLQALAEFHMSRVTAVPSGGYTILGVLPIDEWCVGSGCGCETPGVADDAQMNAVAILSLRLARAATVALGGDTPRSREWLRVSEGIRLLFNASAGRHEQFTSPTCPGGEGGSHYSAAHTVCPEDVMLLTYPLGEYLNVSAAVTRADAEFFIPITCQENAGMTTPIHTIVWLQLQQERLAQAAFNRSLHAACYGPFNVRNEVWETYLRARKHLMG